MTRRRFFAPPDAFERKVVTLTADEAKHLREVLRLKTGEEVTVFDGEGREFRCAITEVRRDFTELEILDEIAPARPESPLTLTLAIALLKGEKFDLVVQKGTELGVTSFTPVTTRFADVQLRDENDISKRVTRWQRIALEAAKQSGRAVVPIVSRPLAFNLLMKGTDESSTRLMFTEREGESLEAERISASNRITALIGSEGGWSDEEIVQARDSGWKLVTLGGRIMRAETAAIAAATLLQHLAGDLK
jgi:16S rRNA (uracil1498-N3)-methyltransferase